MTSVEVLYDKVIKKYPLFIVGEEWWNTGKIYHKYKELGVMPILVQVVDKQIQFKCDDLNLYLDIDTMGGEVYCLDKCIPEYILFILMDYNIRIHHKNVNISALERRWKINRIIE